VALCAGGAMLYSRRNKSGSARLAENNIPRQGVFG
jgi:hypothetical protein